MAELEMEEKEEQVIDTPEKEEGEIETKPSYSEEDLKALEALWIDPENATTDDLIKAAKRAIKAESKIVSIKKEAPKKAETNNDNELRFFFLENPELKDDKEGILSILSQDRYKNLTPQEAHILYKWTKPKESENKKLDFSGWGYKPKPKGLADMSEEEAMKLPPHEYIKRLRLTGELK